MNKKLLSAVFTILICFSINAGEKDKGKTVGMVLVEGNEIVSTFYICDHEVTQSEYKAVIGDNPSKFKGDKKPVERVSWYVAVEYCNALSIKEGLTPCYSKDSLPIFPIIRGRITPDRCRVIVGLLAVAVGVIMHLFVLSHLADTTIPSVRTTSMVSVL